MDAGCIRETSQCVVLITNGYQKCIPRQSRSSIMIMDEQGYSQLGITITFAHGYQAELGIISSTYEDERCEYWN